jgi:hypothetical protein
VQWLRAAQAAKAATVTYVATTASNDASLTWAGLKGY